MSKTLYNIKKKNIRIMDKTISFIRRGGYTKEDFINKKLKPMILLMENNIGPNIYNTYYCDKYVYVLMDKINGQSLDELNYLTSTDNNNMMLLEKKLKELGIDSSDFHRGNIMKTEEDKYLIVDW